MVTEGKKRVRKSPEERKREIIAAAGKLIGEKGYYGTSLKDIADAIGMSQPGLLHYIGNKERLLSLLVTDNYDQQGTPADFAKSGLPGSDSDGMLFPAYLRFLVRYNAQRRSLLQLYMVLETESFNADHPLHEYFEGSVKPTLTYERGALIREEVQTFSLWPLLLNGYRYSKARGVHVQHQCSGCGS
ncbi:TetR/AcrR family transcriptional regulator [Bifidobacterium adolescentis]|uniref:TetR/AcrR family transcriptional regulator n=1 Tax=Bifidobacterium adolescentis TaxID=1680 RepID=UPI0035646DE0